MFPQNIAYEDLEECILSSTLFDKPTQTSDIVERDSTVSNSSQRNRKTIKGCEIEKETNTNEPADPKNSSELMKVILAERYSYCQEVLGPYLKKFSNKYSSTVEAKDGFIGLATDDNICHAKSCKIICPGDKEKAMSPRERSHRKRYNANCEEEASCSVSAACPDEPLDTDSCCCCNSEPSCVERPKCPPPMTECERKPNICDKTMKEANECKLKSCITKCVRDTVKTIKRDQSHCETVIGYIPSKNPTDKTIFYPFNRLRERGTPDCPIKKSAVQQQLESTSTSLSNMKGTVGSFICKMYNKTREVVGLAATNSCKHLGLSNEETHAQESGESCCKRSKKKKCSPSKCTLESNDEVKAELTDNRVQDAGSSSGMLEPATQMFEQVFTTVKNSLTSLSSCFTMENLMDVVTFPKPDRSSAYDVPTAPPTPPKVAHIPTPTPPKQLSQEELTPVHSGMVKSVANKICSIFRYGKKSSANSIPTENIEDPPKELQDEDEDEFTDEKEEQ